MASYLGSYTNDIGIRYKNVLLNAYIYTEGIRSSTGYERDQSVLPTVFKENTSRLDQLTERIAVCSIDYPTLRVAQCFISDGVYYEIPCPFVGGSGELKSFFVDLTNNSEFRLVNLRGENLPYGYNLIMRKQIQR